MAAIVEDEAVEEFWPNKSPDPPGHLGCDRKHERYEWNHWIHVCWIRNFMLGQPMVAGTADLSAGGIGLICPNMVHAGSLGLAMLIGAEQRVKLYYIEVVHCRYMMGSMSHLVGARWIPEPPEMPEVRAEMTPDGPRLIVGQPRSPRDARMRRCAAAIITSQPRGPQGTDRH